MKIEKMKTRADWTTEERKLRREGIHFGIIYLIIILLFMFMFCSNQFHAETVPDGYHAETYWDEEKGEWYSIIVPDSYEIKPYEIDADGAEAIFKQVFNIIYTSILPFSSIIAATFTAYNFTIIMTSKNQRKIDGSYTHIKAIWKVWLYIMLTSVIITLAVQGFNEIVNSPYAQPIIRP